MRTELNNKRIRQAMTYAGINQRDLSRILGKTECEMSVILNHYELAAKAQTEIIRAIRDYSAKKKGDRI